MKRVSMCLSVLAAGFLFATATEAALVQIGTAGYHGGEYKLIYDQEQQLVWLDFSNGPADWQTQMNWAAGLGGELAVTLDPGFTTAISWSTGWRLPVVDVGQANSAGGWGCEGPDETGFHDYWYGFNMVNSELGRLYYLSLYNKGYFATDGTYPQPGWGLLNTGPFENLVAYWYWTGTVYSTYRSWLFSLGAGGLEDGVKLSNTVYGLAVISGEVSAVPLPASALLFASGLAGLHVLRNRKWRKAG